MLASHNSRESKAHHVKLRGRCLNSLHTDRKRLFQGQQGRQTVDAESSIASCFPCTSKTQLWLFPYLPPVRTTNGLVRSQKILTVDLLLPSTACHQQSQQLVNTKTRLSGCALLVIIVAGGHCRLCYLQVSPAPHPSNIRSKPIKSSDRE